MSPKLWIGQFNTMIGKNKTSNNIQLAEMVTFFKKIEGVTFNHQMLNRDKTDFK